MSTLVLHTITILLPELAFCAKRPCLNQGHVDCHLKQATVECLVRVVEVIQLREVAIKTVYE